MLPRGMQGDDMKWVVPLCNMVESKTAYIVVALANKPLPKEILPRDYNEEAITDNWFQYNHPVYPVVGFVHTHT